VVTISSPLATQVVKVAIDRARPAIDPVAATLGPSFPSGHSSTAASLFAALALLAGRRRSVRARAALAGAAVGLAVAVACSRVMLDLHWSSDVVGGLALGWGWFAVCAIAFGGWLVEFGAPVERVAAGPGPAPVSPPGDRPRAGASAGVGARRRDRPAPPGRS
jgi:membrane-associated phospholipid phosphatase